MSFAILQRSLEVPDVEKLRRAFCAPAGLVPADAPAIANHASGILVRGRSIQEAMALQQALQTEGIDTAVVAEIDLPEMPPTHFVKHVECAPENLVVQDSLVRDVCLPWADVLLIAAGHVRMTEFNRKREEKQELRAQPSGPYSDTPIRVHETVVEYNTKEEHLPRWLIEILIQGGTQRLSVVVDKSAPFVFQSLSARKTGNLPHDIALLLQDLTAHAPQALLNRGASRLKANPDDALMYPARNAFFDEIIWLLWQRREASRELPPPGADGERL